MNEKQFLLLLIGGKEVDLTLARQENSELKTRLSEAETRIAELEAAMNKTMSIPREEP